MIEICLLFTIYITSNNIHGDTRHRLWKKKSRKRVPAVQCVAAGVDWGEQVGGGEWGLQGWEGALRRSLKLVRGQVSHTDKDTSHCRQRRSLKNKQTNKRENKRNR